MAWGIYLEGQLVKLSKLQPIKKIILQGKKMSFN